MPYKSLLRKLSLPQKFYIIIGIIAITLATLLASFSFALSTLSSVRAYVGGEGLWSKAQKESFGSLLRYAQTFDEADYQAAIVRLAVPLGDKMARLELQKVKADVAVARQGFLDGGNDESDVGGMIFLFRHFQNVSYLRRAIAIWTAGDERIQQQLSIAERMHAVIAQRDSMDPKSVRSSVDTLVSEAVQNDAAVTLLEDQFSETLGEASRWMGDVLFSSILVLTLAFSVFALAISLRILAVVRQVDAAKGEFVALVSHQLRTPLTVLNLLVELLRGGDARHSPEEKEIIRDMDSEVQQMIGLVDSILDLSRIELGVLRMDPRIIDLCSFAEDQVRLIAPIASEKGIAIKEAYGSAPLTVSMDSSLLSIVFQNLLSNALKYTPRGGTISVAVERSDPDITVWIADTGRGIPTGAQHRIFNKLFRARNARESGEQGLGLGLYIVKSIIVASGGRISFESEEDVGTSFVIKLPSPRGA